MKRLLINSTLWGVLMGLTGFVIFRVAMATQQHSAFNEWAVLVDCILIGLGAVSPLTVITGLFNLPIVRRLKGEFGLCDPSPRGPAYQRTVALLVSGRQLLTQMRLLLVNSRLRVLRATGDSASSETRMACRVRHGVLLVYDIEILVETEGTAFITVHNAHPLARWLGAVELGAAQILAGLVKWAADQGLTVRDFSEPSRPERLDRDLGGWLPKGQLLAARPFDDLESMLAQDRKDRIRAAGRMMGAGIVAIAAFLALAWLDRLAFPIPTAVQLLPVWILFVYMIAQIVRAFGAERRP